MSWSTSTEGVIEVAAGSGEPKRCTDGWLVHSTVLVTKGKRTNSCPYPLRPDPASVHTYAGLPPLAGWTPSETPWPKPSRYMYPLAAPVAMSCRVRQRSPDSA
ncbi:hypothetical protein ACFQL8_20895 [Streptomyces goshikiensis]|uniref:hypothetical protein n=1 Tax=Streptomyces goshikiensis TaxID=1942 RepID=UPI00167A68C7|nr:hypothetical protein [Streptomyces goshikiensis]GHD61498.1 hypothetical protein GCM10010336_15300 [Streptomyces goshikiensis]